MANEAARARAGATFMDVNAVGWPEKIETDSLNLASCEDCVFGQAFDDHYLHVQIRLGLTGEQSASLGFCSEAALGPTFEALQLLSPEAKSVQREKSDAEYRHLRSAWLAEIAARLGTPESEEAAFEASMAATWECPL